METNAILLYDAHCSVCRRFVSWMVKADTAHRLRIAPLQGPMGDAVREQFPEHTGRDSALYLPGQGAAPLARSDAILATAELVGGPWRAAARMARVVPRPVRDFMYRRFAENRKYFAWMGLDSLDQGSRRRIL